MTVAGGNGVHLLTHPVERLVVTAGLVDAATVPVDGAGAAVVTVISTRWLAGAVATPRICACRAKTDTQQPGNADSCRER